MDKRMNDNLMEDYEQEKSFGELDLVDDYMFDVVTEDLESCKLILELAMGIHIKEIRWRENQKVIHNLPGKRGARLDFYVETEEGTVYDVELGDETSKIILNTRWSNNARWQDLLFFICGSSKVFKNSSEY